MSSVNLIDRLLEDHEGVAKDLRTIKEISTRLKPKGFHIEVMTRRATTVPDSSDEEGKKNIGATHYWREVHRISRERSISVADARQVLRDRQKRREHRRPGRPRLVALAN